MKKIQALILIVSILLSFGASAAALIQQSEDFCVTDNADVLTDETRGHIVLNNDTLSGACGAQIVFVTLETTGSRAIDDYALELFNSWHIGSTERNNGILVLMAIRDEDFYACMGTGIETHLSIGDLQGYLDEYLEPDFAVKKYDAGARKLFDALFNKVAAIYGIPQRADPNAYSQWISQNPGGTLPAYSPAANVGQTGNRNEPASASAGNTSHGSSASGNKEFSIVGIIIAVVVLFAVISVLGVISSIFRRSRGGYGGGNFFGGFLLGRMFRPFGRGFSHHHAPRPPRGRNHPPGGGGIGGIGGGLGGFGSRGASSSSGGFKFGGGFGGGRSGGGGVSRGSGAGRSIGRSLGGAIGRSLGGGFGGGFGGGTGRSGGGFGGGRSGGGGISRGAGAGRRK